MHNRGSKKQPLWNTNPNRSVPNLWSHRPTRCDHSLELNSTQFNSTASWVELSWVRSGAVIRALRGVYSDTTQLNSTQLKWTQLTQLNSVQPSQSCFCLVRHDLQTESTVVHTVELSSTEFSWVEFCRYKRAFRVAAEINDVSWARS